MFIPKTESASHPDSEKACREAKMANKTESSKNLYFDSDNRNAVTFCLFSSDIEEAKTVEFPIKLGLINDSLD